MSDLHGNYDAYIEILEFIMDFDIYKEIIVG